MEVEEGGAGRNCHARESVTFYPYYTVRYYGTNQSE
jgi:hypothetical protein